MDKTPAPNRPAPRSAILAAALLLGVILTGCHAPLGDHEIVLAFTHRDTDLNPDKDPQRLADWIQDHTGVPTRIYTIGAESTAIAALRYGHAHAAFMDGAGAWLGWRLYGFDAIAADQRSDGRTHYYATAWVKSDSDIETFADFQGRTSCHTGLLKSAGMFMPLGYLIRNGYAEVVGDPDELESIETTARAFFDDPSIPLSPGEPYEGYAGAFRCLSEGRGEIAFVRDTTWDEHCSGEAPGWCLPRGSYRMIEPAFGAVPSHPVMVGPETSSHMRTLLADALVGLNDSDKGRKILVDVLETPGIVAVDTTGHLSDYAANLESIPGLARYYEDQLDPEQ